MYTINAHEHLHYVMDVILEHYYNNVPVSLSILETSNYASLTKFKWWYCSEFVQTVNSVICLIHIPILFNRNYFYGKNLR